MKALEHPRLALILIAATLLATAGSFGLIEPTETRYAEIAREMRASGDYLRPQLDGLPHYHKPPLAYWTIDLGFALLGENTWGARVPMTLAAIGMLALAMVAARRRFASLELPGGTLAWTLGGSVYFLAIGRSVASDPILALAVAGFWAFAPSVWALLALGLGFLAKGPVVFVHTALPVLLVAWWARDRGVTKLLGPARGWLAFVAVALPWYLLMAIRVPGLVNYLLFVQIWERYTTHVHQRGGPAWYFAAVILAGALPWTPALVLGIRRAWNRRDHVEAKLLLVWLFAPVVFLSFSGSKLPAYVLPCFPAAAMLAVMGLRDSGKAVAWTGAALLACVAVAGWFLGPAALASLVGLPKGAAATLPFGAAFALVCLLYGATWLARSRPAPAGFLVLLAFTSLFATLRRYEAPIGSPRPLARMLSELRRPSEPVVEFLHFNAGVPFHLREQVRLLEVPRENAFEPDPGRPDPRITRDSLAALVQRSDRVWLVGPPVESLALAESLGLRYGKVIRWKKDALGTLSR